MMEWRLNQYYSDIFKATVASVLEVQAGERLGELELEPWLALYSKEIVTRNDFVIKDPPAKVIRQVQLIRSACQALKANTLPNANNLNNPAFLNNYGNNPYGNLPNQAGYSLGQEYSKQTFGGVAL